MKERVLKGVFVAAITGAAAYFRELALPVVVLALVMSVDDISGMVSAGIMGELSSHMDFIPGVSNKDIPIKRSKDKKKKKVRFNLPVLRGKTSLLLSKAGIVKRTFCVFFLCAFLRFAHLELSCYLFPKNALPTAFPVRTIIA